MVEPRGVAAITRREFSKKVVGLGKRTSGQDAAGEKADQMGQMWVVVGWTMERMCEVLHGD